MVEICKDYQRFGEVVPKSVKILEFLNFCRNPVFHEISGFHEKVSISDILHFPGTTSATSQNIHNPCIVQYILEVESAEIADFAKDQYFKEIRVGN